METSMNHKNSVKEDSVFLLRVQFRRNTSWQGTVQCLNSRKNCIFRSVLELGALIDEERSTLLGLNKEKAFKTQEWDVDEEVS
jgi:hypothetical protein